MTLTTIRCTMCTSTVPWGPHCPECGAYLEFAGDPPWRPEPVEPPRESSPPDQDEVAALLDGTTVTATVVDEVGAPEPASAAARPASRPFPTGTIGALVAAAVIAPIIWWAVGPILGVSTGLVLLIWSAVLWPRRTSTVSTAPPPVEEVLVAEGVVTPVETPETLAEEPVEVQARAPQALPRRTVESTRALVLDDPAGSVLCAECTRLNPEDRHYCIWCGSLLPEHAVAPSTTAHDQAPSVAADVQSDRQQRRLSRSWRAPIIVLSLLGVLLASIAFALFGPGAFQVRFGLTTVYQLVNQFIDPYSGNQADVVEVTASSTTRGTSPRDVLGSDAATYWVSAPSSTQGAGESLTFTFDDVYTINRLVILPGIQNGVFDIRGVATPRDITLTFDDGTTAQARLSLVQNQSDLRQLVRFPKVATQTVRLTIDTVYPPRTPSNEFLSEVAISGVRFLAPPSPPEIIRLPTDIQPRTSLPGTT